MRIYLCGVRGSAPASGPEFVRYGGRTSCVAIAHDGHVPTLLLDAGTGLVNVGGLLEGAAFQGSILLGHLHWDHVIGLPFFRAADDDRARVDVFMPEQDSDPVTLLERMMSPPLFPIRPADLRGAWQFHAMAEGEMELEGFTVLAREIPHKGGRTFGFRITDGRASIAYLSDHDPLAMGAGPDGLGAYHEAACALADRTDVLIHDAQYTLDDFPARTGWGHPSVEYALGLARECSAAQVVLFHHDVDRTDAELDTLSRSLPAGASFAVEGAWLDL